MIQTQFVAVGERRVFVRSAGQGPAVVLLHQSPQSSAAMLPWFELLADRYAVFAPDTPGFGHSDPLPMAQPTNPDLAAALAELLRTLGLGPVLLYGVHTGAAIAARLALDYPQLVAGLVCDGLSAFNAEERQPLLEGYLPPFEPLWDGTHLLWLWARIREQYIFFPWHTGTKAARIPYPLMDAQTIHANVMELLDAGDGYRAGYRAPLLYEFGAAGAAHISVPAWLLYRQGDVLRPHMDRLPKLPANVCVEAVADAQALSARTLAVLAQQAVQACSVVAVQQLAQAGSARRVVVNTAHGALAFYAVPGQAAHATLVISDIGTPATLPPDRRAGALTLAMELPGHGASMGWNARALSINTFCDAVLQALEAWPADRVELRATGGSCGLAVALAQRLGARCSALNLTSPMRLSDEQRERFLSTLPSLAVQDSGAHLIAAWNWARLRHLFHWWLPMDANAAVMAAAPPPQRVHADVREMLRAGDCWAALWRVALHVDLDRP